MILKEWTFESGTLEGFTPVNTWGNGVTLAVVADAHAGVYSLQCAANGGIGYAHGILSNVPAAVGYRVEYWLRSMTAGYGCTETGISVVDSGNALIASISGGDTTFTDSAGNVICSRTAAAWVRHVIEWDVGTGVINHAVYDDAGSTLGTTTATLSASIGKTPAAIWCKARGYKANHVINYDNIVVEAVAGAPTAGFTVTPADAIIPAEIVFKDTSVGPVTTWLWNFGDGATSTEQNPTHTYTDPGTYTVSLSVENEFGTSQTSHQVDALPNRAVFSATGTSGTPPLTVTFTDASEGADLSWLWDFGDGETSTEQHPVHTYMVVGTHTVSLTTENALGTNTKTEPDLVTVDPLVASFTSDLTTAIIPAAIQFTDASSGTFDSWLWDFGDGETSVEQNPRHVYMVAGVYTVKLTAANAAGSATKTAVGLITVLPNRASFTATNVSGIGQVTTQFTDTSEGHFLSSWLWDFGDGTTSTEQNPSHTYTVARPYTVTLAVTNDFGTSTVTTKSCVVVWPDHTRSLWTFEDGDISAFVAQGAVSIALYAGGHVSVNSLSLTTGLSDNAIGTAQTTLTDVPAGGLYRLAYWSTITGYGDDLANGMAMVNASGVVIARIARSLNYGSTMTATNGTAICARGSGWVRQVITVNSQTGMLEHQVFSESGALLGELAYIDEAAIGAVPKFLQAQYNKPSYSGNRPVSLFDDIQFSYTAGDPIADTIGAVQISAGSPTFRFGDASAGGPLSFLWDFGDGATSTERNPEHVYTTPGDYDVTLTVANAAGQATATIYDEVTVLPVYAEFTFPRAPYVVPATIAFADASTYVTTSPATWLWDFGDGATSTELNPVHTYTTPGTYTVSLVASSDIGVDTMTKTDMVAVEAPDFDFTADVVEGIVPLAVQFTDISTEPYPTTWAWDFGDGETAAVKDPLHLYKLPGIYTVILTASNQYYTDIIIKQAMISIDGKISGSVCDAWVRYEQEQDVPIPSAQIACGDYPVVLTDGSGEFSFIAPSSVPVGTRFRISARVDGCITATKQFVYTGDTVVDPFRLWPHPVL